MQLSLFEKNHSGFVSDAQKKIVNENPFFNLFDGKTLEELGANTESFGKTYYTTDHPILEAFWTAQTIALEELYLSVDARFLRPYRGAFQIRNDATGELQRIDYEFEPYEKPNHRPRITPPTPRFQFKSAEPSPISFTGYRHHPMKFIPVSEVRSMEDLIRFAVREILKNDTEPEIIFL
jgi:hypothetical protein